LAPRARDTAARDRVGREREMGENDVSRREGRRKDRRWDPNIVPRIVLAFGVEEGISLFRVEV